MQKIYSTLLEKRNSSIADGELSDLGIDLHPFDISTGATSPSVTSYFLPRTDFPDVVDSPDLVNTEVFRAVPRLNDQDTVPRRWTGCGWVL
ncbi:uncharacterized protein N7483_000146 [Penicillium malachiteum]|uniref:uncharacterized protein n=1 Tax=Penicillium malachiteum TaxID=1324776 RepID=UPI0025468136|nr:uncharacterized protein N7483_000146 [Penicillium malachiteum]KAJ5735021.1 hypothetical protein N7483_000146 [Penicillium malachiteum]